jgi:hypothetical protein
LAIDITTGVITIAIIVAVDRGTAAVRVGLFRAATARPIMDRAVRVGDTVKHGGRLRAAFSFGIPISSAAGDPAKPTSDQNEAIGSSIRTIRPIPRLTKAAGRRA